MSRSHRVLLVAALGCATALPAPLFAGSASMPLGEPVLEQPTLHCVGAYWIIRGDANRNARVEVAYCQTGAAEWRSAMPLFRVEKGAWKGESGDAKVTVPDDAWLFAGSVFLLQPDTEYELQLRLADPDGGEAERTLRARTIAEPVAPRAAPQWDVVPGDGDGAGTPADPYRGLAAAQARAKPGDVFLLHAGTYPATFEVERSGEPGRPIIWQAAGDGKAVIDGQGNGGAWAPRGVSASDRHDVWFEGVTIRNAEWGLVAHDSARIVVRRCRFANVKCGITSTRNTRDDVRGFFISDNVLEGPMKWPRPEGEIEEDRGIQITGAGHVICYNRISGFKDGIDTFPSSRCEAIDIHNNEISECTDDGTEMDGSYRNTRCYLNRYTNVFQGVSMQPVYGGPVYILRNALYNVQVEPLKLHNSPSGVVILHNTCVKQGMPALAWTNDRVRNCVSRNNLFIGTDDKYTGEFLAPMIDCDFDYDGFARIQCTNFLKWNNVRYRTLVELIAKGLIEKHARLVEVATLFASGILPPADYREQFALAVNDLRLQAGAEAVDAGQVLPGINDGFAGQAPDLGAYELGTELPYYGPRSAQ